jgi:hypothetical protein
MGGGGWKFVKSMPLFSNTGKTWRCNTSYLLALRKRLGTAKFSTSGYVVCVCCEERSSSYNTVAAASIEQYVNYHLSYPLMQLRRSWRWTHEVRNTVEQTNLWINSII